MRISTRLAVKALRDGQAHLDAGTFSQNRNGLYWKQHSEPECGCAMAYIGKYAGMNPAFTYLPHELQDLIVAINDHDPEDLEIRQELVEYNIKTDRFYSFGDIADILEEPRCAYLLFEDKYNP